MKRNLIFQSIVVPIGLLIAFSAFPEWDIASAHPLFHFYLVTFFTFVAVVSAILVGITLSATSPVRHQLLATTGAAMGIIFFFHGVNTPGALTYIFNPGVRWGAWLTLFTGSLLFVIASWDKPDKPLQMKHLRLVNMAVAVLCAAFSLTVLFVPQWLAVVDARIAPWHQQTAFVITLLAWCLAAWRMWRIWRITGNQLDGVMALIATWLAIASVSQNQFATWQLSWWIYHVLLMMSAITAVYYLLHEYEQTRQFRLTYYYAVTSLIAMAGLALLISFISSTNVQREREDFLREQSLALGQDIAATLNMDLPERATTADLDALLAMPTMPLSLMLEGQLLSADVMTIRIYDRNQAVVYDYAMAEAVANELTVDNGRLQQSLTGQDSVSLQLSPQLTEAGVPATYVQTYTPIAGEPPAGSLVLLQNVTGLNEAILQARSNSLLISLSAMGFLFLALLVIVHRADQLVTARSDELAHAYHDLQTAEMARDDMTDMIVHDLRSPLTAVEISLQMLRKGTFNNELNRTRLLNNAYNSLQRAVSLINDMLGVAKLEEGKLTLSRAPLDVKCLLQERAAFYTVQAESEQKSIEVLAADTLPQPQADKEIMTRVLDNLIGNSLKYVKRGGHIRLQALPENNHIRIAVIDDGQGISPRDAERIFDKFAQADNDASRRGTGLGLTFCRLAVEAHGGKIWVESAINQGSTFFFTLPL